MFLYRLIPNSHSPSLSFSLFLSLSLSQGNLTFGVDGDVILIENSKVVSVIGELLSTKEENVEKALLYRTVATGRDVIDKQHTLQEASYGRDALAKVTVAQSAADSLMMMAFHSLHSFNHRNPLLWSLSKLLRLSCDSLALCSVIFFFYSDSH